MRCLLCRQEAVARRRKTIKALLVAEHGGQCVSCGYDKEPSALHFHHVDPETKSFALGMAGLTRALETVRAEAAKCVLLCARCHAEVEAGVAALDCAARADMTGGATAVGGSSIGRASGC